MLKQGRAVLLDGVERLRVFPGAQAAIYDDGRIESIAVGTLRHDQPNRQVDDNTLFDLASLTKPIATAASIAMLLQEGKLGLDDRVATHLSLAENSPFANCTIEQLLSHTAGFAAWLPLYDSVPEKMRGQVEAIDPMLDALLKSEPAAAPGAEERYSDLDYFLLGHLVHKASGLPLDAFAQKSIFEPLGSETVGYRPKDFSDIAPTGLCPWKKTELAGQVHDDNTRACGGVAGQAGLFGTALSLIPFMAEIIEGLEGQGTLFDPELLDLMCTRPFPKLAGSFTLGWDTVSKVGTLTGSRFGPQTIGHHGFTGCSLWIDPQARVGMALLTNHVFNSLDKAGINRIRPAFFDAVWEDLGKG